ncbi:hypothetical protein Nepgr_025362 [Nepenthes gracilis]|uniref:Uncharacterized protein n=1 Tax=Nepenthes gracilis TaxID=150966 RepID=A0AAD3Y0Z4_NEPGR|nr:hypothetical protein Nepgr_025362 [Nepenthes gracilis]
MALTRAEHRNGNLQPNPAKYQRLKTHENSIPIHRQHHLRCIGVMELVLATKKRQQRPPPGHNRTQQARLTIFQYCNNGGKISKRGSKRMQIGASIGRRAASTSCNTVSTGLTPSIRPNITTAKHNQPNALLEQQRESNKQVL